MFEDLPTLEELMFTVAREARPEERLSVSGAAQKYIRINKPGSYVGQFSPDYTPYMTEPTDLLSSRDFRGVIFCGPVQSGKTQAFQSWLTYTLKIDPADMIIYAMTNAHASDFTVTRIDRLLSENAHLGEMLLKGSSSDSMFRKMFRNGVILNISWPSATELASRSIPRVFMTDYDSFDQDVAGEGSPFVLAEKRTTVFRRNAKIMAESTPKHEITDLRWTQPPDHPHEAPPTLGVLGLYNMGDRRRWMWHCVACKTPFEPDFSTLKWPDTKDIMEASEAAYLACPSCGQIYEHDTSVEGPSKNEMNSMHARWIKEGELWRPNREISGAPRRSRYASFWLKGPAARFQTWSEIVFEYLTAMEQYQKTMDEGPLKSVTNTRMALPYRPRSAESLRAPEAVMARARDLGHRVVPQGGRFLVAAVDVQKNRFVVQVHAIGRDNEIWVVDRFDVRYSKRPDDSGGFRWVQPGSHPEDWDLLIAEVIEKKYPLADGSGKLMPVHMTFCDSGGQEGVTTNAYEFWRRLRSPPEFDEETEDEVARAVPPPGAFAKFQLVIGRPKPGAPRYQITYPDSQRKDRFAGAKGEIPVAQINSDPVKDQLDNILNRTDPGARVNFPNWLQKEFYDELCAEVRDEKGRWQKVSKRNESWDLLAYVLAGLLDERINVEAPAFWANPPSWAAEWDKNPFLIDPNAGTEAQSKRGGSDILSRLSRLGSEIA